MSNELNKISIFYLQIYKQEMQNGGGVAPKERILCILMKKKERNWKCIYKSIHGE